MFLILVTLFLLITHSLCVHIDPLGYIAYCPCMGRFGNQADHFLGALGFAHALNRTLILPHWVEYRYGEPKSIQVPFNKYFQVEPLKSYTKVILMSEFMEKIAPAEWPPQERVVFCYGARGENDGPQSCNAKHGNPFGPFWDTFGIDFVRSEFYAPLHYDVYHHDMAKKWNAKYPPKDYPVLAFTGAPAAFPIQEENRHLHKFLIWSEEIERKASEFITHKMQKVAFIGIHLRNGLDWSRACKHIPQSPNLFSAPQCVGYKNEHGKATMEMCMPSKETILRQLKRLIKSYNANSNNRGDIRAVFVASDSNHMLPELNEGLKRMKVRAYKYDKDEPHVDLAILAKSNHFVGNCISSFSAFVKRERDVKGFPSSFWAFPKERSHDEL